MKNILVLFILCVSTSLLAQNDTKQLLVDFKKASFYEDVYPSKLALENFQKGIIPDLIKILNDTSFVKLTGTADLIYPGAKEFYGHGHFIPYDMDWISVRAGWLLEDITFQDFGYKTTGVDDAYLFKLMSENYNNYIDKGSYDLEWKNKPEKEKLIMLRKAQAKSVETWWKANEKKWSRFEAISEALASNNEQRVSKAVQFLRYGETKCDGLDKEKFRKILLPLAMRIKDETNNAEIKKNVAMLEKQDLSYWTEKMKELNSGQH